MLRYQTAGESHGKALVAHIDGFPAGVTLDQAAIDSDLRLRQGGYGRGGRQKLETDSAEFLSGVWQNTTLGSPIVMQVVNQDYKLERLKELERPRPGHADLTGAIKYLSSIRGILERSSARETAARVAAGSLAKQLLTPFGIEVLGYVVEIGGLACSQPAKSGSANSGSSSAASSTAWNTEQQRTVRNQSIVYTLEPAQDEAYRQLIDDATAAGDTLGGILEVRVEGLPFGLGSHAQWDQKLDGRIAQAVMSIQAIKGVEIGLGFEAARRRGSQVHDPIHYDSSQSGAAHLGYLRPTNNAGGIEGGMTNGQPLIVRAAKKPISTLRKPLDSINMETKEPQGASYERSDVCAVPAAAIIVECVVAFEIAAAMVEKFGGDSLEEMKQRYELFGQMARNR